MSLLRPTFLVLTLMIAGATALRADDLLPADRPIENVVDHYIDLQLQNEGLSPTGLIDDAAYIRRVTLDLVGRIPTVAETQTFVASTDPQKKAQLVERLLASPGYARHQVNEFDALLMTDTRTSLRDYLTLAFAEKRTWDRIFRELLLPDENDPKQRGSGVFLKQRVADLDKLTGDVSVVFFGINITCARCHDHPLVQDWKQDHFFGMKAFLARTFDNGGFVGEREYGLVKFKTTKGQDKQASLMFLTGKVIDSATNKEPSAEEQKREKAKLDEFKQKKQPPPPPSFSARKQLVDIALQPGQQPYFARSIVNRLWLRFFGHGLVMPVDQMHSESPPSHPELLTWLARDVSEHGYDLRRLMRGLVLSKTYARTSRWDGDTPPAPNLFAVARVRPLSPMQLAVSLRLATTDPGTLPANLPAAELEKRLDSLERSASGMARSFEQPGEDFQIGVNEALLFSNSEQVQRELLADSGDRLVGRLKLCKERSEAIELAFRNILSRTPRPEEMAAVNRYLEQRAGKPAEAYRLLVWALLTSSEFRFNS